VNLKSTTVTRRRPYQNSANILWTEMIAGKDRSGVWKGGIVLGL